MTDSISEEYLLMIATVSGVNADSSEFRAILLLFLLELYPNAPKKYLEMLMIAMRDEFPEWIIDLSRILKEDKAEYNTPLEDIYAYLASRGSTQLADHVRQDVIEKEEKNTLFRNYRKSTRSKRGFHLTKYSSALLRILLRILQKIPL